MSRRIATLIMLFTTPLLLGSMDGVVLCVCDYGIHLEAPHSGSCRTACCEDACFDGGSCMHGASHACKDTRLGGIGALLTAGVSGKPGAAKAPLSCAAQTLVGALIPARPALAGGFACAADPAASPLLRSCILLI